MQKDDDKLIGFPPYVARPSGLNLRRPLLRCAEPATEQ